MGQHHSPSIKPSAPNAVLPPLDPLPHPAPDPKPNPSKSNASARSVAGAPPGTPAQPAHTFEYAYGKSTTDLHALLPNLPAVDTEEARLMKNLIFAPTHKAYTREKNAVTGGRAMNKEDWNGDWSILPGILRDGTRQARSIVPYLRVQNNKTSIVLAVWSQTQNTDAPFERVFDFKGKHAAALLSNVKLFNPSNGKPPEGLAPDLIDHDAKIVLHDMHGLLSGECHHTLDISTVIGTISKAEQFGVSLLVTGGGSGEAYETLRFMARTEAAAGVPDWSGFPDERALKHYAELTSVHNFGASFYMDLNKIIAARLASNGPLKAQAPALPAAPASAPAPAPAPVRKTVGPIRAHPKPAAAPAPASAPASAQASKKRTAQPHANTSSDKPKSQKKQKKITHHKDSKDSDDNDDSDDSDDSDGKVSRGSQDHADEASLSGSGSDTGSPSASSGSSGSESDEEDDSEESEVEESDDDAKNTRAKPIKPTDSSTPSARKIDAIGRNIATTRKPFADAPVSDKHSSGGMASKTGTQNTNRDEEEDDDDDDDMPSNQGMCAKDNKRKPAKARRQATERLCIAAMEQVQGMMDVIPESHRKRLEEKVEDLRNKLSPFVEDGKVLQGGRVMEAQIGLVSELATIVAKIGAADASRGPDVKASRELGIKAAKLWVDQRSKFSALNEVLGQWAGTVAEMNASMLRVAQDLDRTSSALASG